MKIRFTNQERLFLQTAVAAVGESVVEFKAIEKTDWPKLEALKRLHNQLSPQSIESNLGQDDVVVLKQVVGTSQAHLKTAGQRELTEEQRIRLTALTEVYSSISIKLNQGTALKEKEFHGSSK